MSDAERLMFSRELNRDMGISYFLNPDDYRKSGRGLVDGDISVAFLKMLTVTALSRRQIAGFDGLAHLQASGGCRSTAWRFRSRCSELKPEAGTTMMLTVIQENIVTVSSRCQYLHQGI
ncbi:hypothetical protein ACNKHW_01540 [Shigella flexneri]